MGDTSRISMECAWVTASGQQLVELLVAQIDLYRPGGEDVAFGAGSSLRVVQTSRLGRVGVLVCFDGDFFESAKQIIPNGCAVPVVRPTASQSVVAGEVTGVRWPRASACGERSAAAAPARAARPRSGH
jgi:predicted amidohydrolase